MTITTKPVDEIVEALLPYGEWSDEATTKAVDLVAELVRHLNHATQNADALPYPVTVANVLTSLQTAVQRLPQLLGQLASRERAFAADPNLQVDSTVTDGTEPGEIAEWAATELETVAVAADALLSALQAAAKPANKLRVYVPWDDEDDQDDDEGRMPTLVEQAAAAAADAARPVAKTNIGGYTDPFTADIAKRCRIVLSREGGHPLEVWSTGEQIAVALVLHDEEHLKAMAFTAREAAQRVAGDVMIDPADIGHWLSAVRTEIRRRAVTDAIAYVDDDYDRRNASDGYSRFGAYLHDRDDQLAPDRGEEQINPDRFAATCWTIATSPVMAPGYVQLRPDVSGVQISRTDDGDRLAATVHVRFDWFKGLADVTGAYGWSSWEHPWYGSEEHRSYVYPNDDRRALLLTAELVVPIDTKDLPVRTATGPWKRTAAEVQDAKNVVRAVCKLVDAATRGVIDGGLR